MTLTREQITLRKREFPQYIIDLSYNNTVISKMIAAYVHGQLLTKEETYCQMIRELAKTRDELIKERVDETHMNLNTRLL